MKDSDKPTVGPVHLQIFRPSVIRGPTRVLGPTVNPPDEKVVKSDSVH